MRSYNKIADAHICKECSRKGAHQVLPSFAYKIGSTGPQHYCSKYLIGDSQKGPCTAEVDLAEKKGKGKGRQTDKKTLGDRLLIDLQHVRHR
jgi:hypothetical protein